jgi:hypothetical protein
MRKFLELCAEMVTRIADYAAGVMMDISHAADDLAYDLANPSSDTHMAPADRKRVLLRVPPRREPRRTVVGIEHFALRGDTDAQSDVLLQCHLHRARVVASVTFADGDNAGSPGGAELLTAVVIVQVPQGELHMPSPEGVPVSALPGVVLPPLWPGHKVRVVWQNHGQRAVIVGAVIIGEQP